MTRLHIIVEGQTEETFVRDVLAPHLGQFHVFVDARCVLMSRHKTKLYRGGLADYEKVKKDLQNWMKEDKAPEVYFTTMFDLYALPENFPAYTQAGRENDPYRKIEILKSAFNQDLQHPRFIPYIQLYEFETLLFVDVQHFDWEFLEHDDAIQKLRGVAAQFDNPELINNGGETAPSKRIIKMIPEYESRKASAGPLIAGKIGVPLLRQKCQHFNGWLTALEKLGLL